MKKEEEKQLEALSAEELETVAGGAYGWTAWRRTPPPRSPRGNHPR